MKLATWSRDGIVRIFDFPTTNSPFELTSSIELKGHTLSVTSAAVNKDSTLLASGGRDYNTFLWDLVAVTQSFHPIHCYQS